jgi:hypothetical protein
MTIKLVRAEKQKTNRDTGSFGSKPERKVGSEFLNKMEEVPNLKLVTTFEIDGKDYVRSGYFGNEEREGLVRRNMHKLVRRVKKMGRRALREGDLDHLVDICLDPKYRAEAGHFTREDGSEILGRELSILIRHFFRDEDLVKQLKGEINEEHEVWKNLGVFIRSRYHLG